MANKLYNETSIQDIANAIREKNGSSTTYKVSEMGNAIREIEVGTKENRITYTGTNTQTILGLNAYLTIATDPKLAEIRNQSNLFIRVEFKVKQPQAYTILKSWGTNQFNVIPYGTTTQYQMTLRFDDTAEYGHGYCMAPINGTPAGVGCIHITESGELRVYSLSSSNYAIRPSEWKAIVEW